MLEGLRFAIDNSPDNLLGGHHVIDFNNDALGLHEKLSVIAAIVWMPPENFFDGLDNLKTIYALSAGVDQLLTHPGLPENVDIIRLRDAGMSSQMAEYVLYGTLRAHRKFHEFDIFQNGANWQRGIEINGASDTHVGILGAGVLATAAAQKLAHNGYKVTCWSQTKKPSSAGVEHCCGNDALDELLKKSQVLVCLLPLTSTTQSILNTTLFYSLPQGAYIINAARGQHLVDVDLLNAIDDGQISGALLDVFAIEPLNADHPFWKHSRITVTPHEAARSLVEESVKQIVDNIAKTDNGEHTKGLINRSRGY